MAFGPGRLGVFKLDTLGGVLTDLSGYCNKIDAPFTVTMADTTVLGLSAEASIPVLKNGDKITASGLLDPTMFTQISAIWNAMPAFPPVSLTFEYGPMGPTTGNPKFGGESFLSSFKTSSEVKNAVPFDLEITVTGGATSSAY